MADALGRVVLRPPAAPAAGTAARTLGLRSQPVGRYGRHPDTPRGPAMEPLVIR